MLPSVHSIAIELGENGSVIEQLTETVALFLAFSICSGILWLFPFLMIAQMGKNGRSHHLILTVWKEEKKKTVSLNDCA